MTVSHLQGSQAATFVVAWKLNVLHPLQGLEVIVIDSCTTFYLLLWDYGFMHIVEFSAR